MSANNNCRGIMGTPNISPIGNTPSHRLEECCTPFQREGNGALSIKEKICNFVRKIFATLWHLPARYCGEKPLAGYSYQMQKQLSPEELKPYMLPAFFAAFIHGTDGEWIPWGWDVIKPQALEVADENIEARDLCFFDPESGLKVAIIAKGQEAFVVFGGAGSGFSEFPDNPTRQKKRLLLDHTSVLLNLLGTVPYTYRQAETFFARLKEHPVLQGKTITLTGQCYGGSLASYVALKHNLPAVCFNALALGAGLQQDIGNAALKQADKYVTHIIAKGDPVSDAPITLLDSCVGKVGIRTPGNFGIKFSIPSAYKTGAETHSFILGSILHHLGYGKRAKPWTVFPDDPRRALHEPL
jgi:hypothetical protein